MALPDEPQDALALFEALGPALPADRKLGEEQVAPAGDTSIHAMAAELAGPGATAEQRLEKELELAAQTLLRIERANREAQPYQKVAAHALEYVQNWLRRIDEWRDGRQRYHEARLEEWRRGKQDPSKKSRSYQTLAGTVGLRAVPAKVELNERAIIAHAVDDDSLYADGIVYMEVKVSRTKFLKRFEDAAGGTVDRRTGAIINEVAYYNETGDRLVGPMTVEVAPAGDKLTYKVTVAGTAIEREDDDGE